MSPVAVKSIVGLESPTADGFERVQPPDDRPLAIAKGDRLWAKVLADPDLWVYGIACAEDRAWRVFLSPPSRLDDPEPGHRFPFPKGWVLSTQDAQMETLLVVTSAAPIDALESSADQALAQGLVSELQNLAPPRIRGKAKLPLPEMLHVQDVVLVFGNVAEHEGQHKVAVETPFVQRG